MLIQDYLDICDPVLTFDRFIGEIELEKYLKNIPQHYTGRFRIISGNPRKFNYRDESAGLCISAH